LGGQPMEPRITGRWEYRSPMQRGNY